MDRQRGFGSVEPYSLCILTTGDKADGTRLILASAKAANIGMRRSKGRHKRQVRWNTFKETLVGDTGDKAGGTLFDLG